LASRITGLVREQIMAATFGASAVTDAFNVAFRIPNLLRRLFAEGAFSQAFVPMLAQISNWTAKIYPKHLWEGQDGFETGPHVNAPIGSGPFKFVESEYRPGSRVVYDRNPDYVPRSEAASGIAGGKRVLLDRVIWDIMPDAQTAANALLAGEVDFFEVPPIELLPMMEGQPGIKVEVMNKLGNVGYCRLNHLHPPFNNVLARRAAQLAINQEDIQRAAIGQAPHRYAGQPDQRMLGTLGLGAARDRALGLLIGDHAIGAQPFHETAPVDGPHMRGARRHRFLDGKVHGTSGLNTRTHWLAGRPHCFAIWAARATHTARAGREGVRWASTTVLPSRVALKGHRAPVPKASAMRSRLRVKLDARPNRLTVMQPSSVSRRRHAA
jgi:hypothetical protein